MNLSTNAPSLQDIAKHTGFSRSAISLALRGDPSLPPQTREKICEAAQRLGYRPNPLVAALMAQTRDKRRVHRASIALVSRSAQSISQMKSHYHRLVHEGISSHAATHGFDLTEFHYDANAPVSDVRLSQILVSRGIHGVLLFAGNPKAGDAYPSLKWDDFATVLVGYGTRQLSLHQVSSDYSYDIDLVLGRVTNRREKRVGLVIPSELDDLTDRSWTARYLLYQNSLPPRQRLPVFTSPRDAFDIARDSFLEWFHRTRPSTIITHSPEPLVTWIKQTEARVPADVKIIHLLKREKSAYAGVDPQTAEVGRAAVDLLISLLQTNQRGMSKFARSITIKGVWSPGSSFPE